MSQQIIHPRSFSATNLATVQTTREELIQAVAKYAQPDYQKAFWQLSNTVVPYLGLWALMSYFVVQGYAYWLTLLLAVPAAGLLVRIFIVHHRVKTTG